jgi:hypothetical protein
MYFFYFFRESVKEGEKDIKESSMINKSITALTNVIRECTEKQKEQEKCSNLGGGIFVNYRNSNLTRLLKNSLGGSCKTILLATVSTHVGNVGVLDVLFIYLYMFYHIYVLYFVFFFFFFF